MSLSVPGMGSTCFLGECVGLALWQRPRHGHCPGLRSNAPALIISAIRGVRRWLARLLARRSQLPRVPGVSGFKRERPSPAPRKYVVLGQAEVPNDANALRTTPGSADTRLAGDCRSFRIFRQPLAKALTCARPSCCVEPSSRTRHPNVGREQEPRESRRERRSSSAALTMSTTMSAPVRG